MPQRILTENDITTQQATDVDLQVTTATGANDTKWPTPRKLFNWRAWFMGLVNAFTNTTESTSTSTGAVTIAGGLGVLKSLFTKALTVTDLSGSGARLTTVDSNGLFSAPFIVTAPTITDTTIQNAVILESNWNDSGVYSGSAIANGIQNQFYRNGASGNWLYMMYDSTTPVRMSLGTTMHIRGNSGTPSAVLAGGAGTGASGLVVGGNDIGMNFNFTSGASGLVAGTIITITFSKAYSVSLKSVVVQAANATSAAVQANLYPSALGTTSFALSTTTPLAPSTVYNFYITIVS